MMTKVVLGAGPIARLPSVDEIGLVVAMVPVGILTGGLVARQVSSDSEVGRRVAVVVVTLGAVTPLGRGSGAWPGCLSLNSPMK